MGLLILVVDDDPDIRQFIRQALESEGHRTCEASDVVEALAVLEKGPVPDVLLLDLGIPKGGGAGLLKAMKGRPEWGDVRILFMSGNLDVGILAQALGAHGTLEKPFSLETLFATVSQVSNAGARPPRGSVPVPASPPKEVFPSEKDARAFFRQSSLGVAILQGPEHVWSFVNPAFMQLCFGGRPASELLHKTMRVAMPELQGQGFHEILDDVYRTGKTFNGANLRVNILQPGGIEKEMFVNFTYQAKRNDAGVVDGIFVFVYEVTQQVNEQREVQLLADKLRAALSARDAFLGIASHELNTPLTSLKLQLQMNQRLLARQGAEAFPDEKVGKLLQHVEMQVDRLSALVNDMLEASRIGFGKVSLKKVRTNVTRLVADVLERADLSAKAAGCTLTSHLASDVYAEVDPARLEQVVTNLIANALKYAPGRPVTVILERTDDRFRMSVRDEGQGLAREAHERVFERFERAVSQESVGGLGLGLYIAKVIVQEHGGTIRVDSEPGQGATFSFEIPCLEAREDVSPAPP